MSIERVIFISIRDYIIDNFKNSNIEDIKLSIDEALKKEDEITLPGLGVFFELLWLESSSNDRNKIVNSLYNKIKK